MSEVVGLLASLVESALLEKEKLAARQLGHCLKLVQSRTLVEVVPGLELVVLIHAVGWSYYVLGGP